MNDDGGPSLQTRFMRPPGWEWGTFRNSSGARLRYGFSEPTEVPRARIVLLTGFREFGEKYFETIRDFLALGYSVWQMDWYGQGGSDRHLDNHQKVGGASLTSAVADLRLFVKDVLPRDPETPFIIVSHSTGGLIAVRYLHDYPDTITAAVMSAPLFALYTNGLPAWLVLGLARLAVMIGLGSKYIPGGGDWLQDPRRVATDSPTSNDPERRLLQEQWMEAYPNLQMGGPTFSWLDSALRLMRESTRASYLQAVRTPILIGSAGRDSLVRSEAHGRAAGLLPNAELVRFPEAKHELFLETDAARDRWLAEIDRFIEAQIIPTAVGTSPHQTTQGRR